MLKADSVYYRRLQKERNAAWWMHIGAFVSFLGIWISSLFERGSVDGWQILSSLFTVTIVLWAHIEYTRTSLLMQIYEANTK